MRQIWTAKELKEADAQTMQMGLASPVLMERAALAVVHVMQEEGLDLTNIAVVCGTGNNGGDGIAIARIVAEMGFRPTVLTAGDPSRYTEERRMQEQILRHYDAEILPADRISSLENKSLIVDALFGIGLSSPVRKEYETLIRKINDARLPVVSVDIPSGIHTDTGAVLGCAVKASHTVSFSGIKAGLLLYPGKNYAGKVHVRKIGIRMPDKAAEDRYLQAEEQDLRLLPERDEAGNKGTFGKVLVIAGSHTVCGAAILSGKACLRSGAGMVRIYTEEANRIPVAASFPEALIDTYTEGNWSAGKLDTALAWADAVLIGPGIGTEKTAEAILDHVLMHTALPLVMDADALNLLRGDPAKVRNYPGPCVLTPHVMEMSRLSGLSCEEIKQDPKAAAQKIAEQSGAIVILKDAVTMIAAPEGPVCLYAEGGSELATAGSGDVLAGIVVSLAAQCPDNLFRDAVLAVCLHGYSGKKAAECLSKAAVTAGDLTAHLAF
ncbi:MAG: NAD(P)H-hydrate dehydratase [Eubacterium sp.]|nr:NAD(P)H-hydrate dehydratase [Eubacterium sp.]